MSLNRQDVSSFCRGASWLLVFVPSVAVSCYRRVALTARNGSVGTMS
jgi:hypothetical protein